MQLWTAFLLGFVGSAHCAGMCGPLALALPHFGRGQSSFLLGRLLYNFGRIITYAAMGAGLGSVGKGIVLAGVQRWLSLGLGSIILLGVLLSPQVIPQIAITRAVNWLKSCLGQLLQRRGMPAMFGIGLLNGMLPCGLVYVAAAASIATGDTLSGIRYMLAFGLGTLPMLIAISIFGTKLQFVLRFRIQRLIPASLLLVGTLLVLRGMALGIPYVSPKLPVSPAAVVSCH